MRVRWRRRAAPECVCLKPLDEAPERLAPFQTPDRTLIIDTDFSCGRQFVVIEKIHV